MWQRLGRTWMTGILFFGTLVLATCLGLLVWLAPWLLEEEENRLLEVFAQDSTVRRTSLASALGLVVTAFVFFRPGPLLPGKKSRSRRPPPNNMAGA